MNAPNDRDRAIERVLRQSAKTPPPEATESCLDPETFAAWVDGGLKGRQLELAESHLADCARCQALLGAFVQVSRVDVNAVSGRTEEAAPPSRRWLGWLIPLTAAAAAVAFWVAVPRGPVTAPPQPPAIEREATQEKAPEAPAPPAGRRESFAVKEEQAAAAKRDEPRSDRPQASALSKDTDSQELDRLKQQSQTADAAAANADKLRAAAEPAALAPAAAPLPASPDLQATFRSGAANAAAQKAAPSGAPLLSSATRWRISGTNLERSTDSGATWSTVATPVGSQLTWLASPSNTVCWVVGRRGLVLRTIDGQNFSRVTFPETTDLTAVMAASAQVATVTMSDGRMVTTTDGGVSWR